MKIRMKNVTGRNPALIILLIIVCMQITGCDGYDAGSAFIHEAVDYISRAAGRSDGRADESISDSSAIATTDNTQDDAIVIDFDERDLEEPEQSDNDAEEPQNITEDYEHTQAGGADSPGFHDRTTFDSVIDDPDDL